MKKLIDLRRFKNEYRFQNAENGIHNLTIFADCQMQ